MTPPPSPPLPFDQILELLRHHVSTEPLHGGGTLITWPLHHHGLIEPVESDRGTRWQITERGRVWIHRNARARVVRAATIKRISAAQLVVLTTVGRGHGSMGTQRTREALYRNGLIDWVVVSSPSDWTWSLSPAGAALLAGSTPR